ncbi:hypothetical protein AURDEDRAFT_115981 [Auricularia subglabra TFB-10046 SS5]|uniref:Uncharacterized protein n=1 Tax=Auricularia subglabra (strain TFB-10046 / SS5) TaxID=717982 RepID=J0WY26_AURST|nr:hypothetical protein AURDEDRAFT_115981 [Auricularia subglabra TFB-10046 SS5]
MSIRAFRNVLRLYRPQLRLVPKSRLGRYGLAVAAASAAGMWLMYQQLEGHIWSDEWKPDPPMPPQYERRYRFGAFLNSLGGIEAWDELRDLWRMAAADNADPAILVAIAAEMVRADADAPLGEEHDMVAETLRRLLRDNWDSVNPRERERAISLAHACGLREDDEMSVSIPFLQWAWAQAWHLAVEGTLKSIEPAATTLDLTSQDGVKAVPIALVIAEFFEQRRKQHGLEPMQQCNLAKLYTSLAFLFMSHNQQLDIAHKYHRRALAVLEPATDPEGTAWGHYLMAISRVFFHIGLHYELIGHLDEALNMYLRAQQGMPDDAMKQLVHTSILRIAVRKRQILESEDKR